MILHSNKGLLIITFFKKKSLGFSLCSLAPYYKNKMWNYKYTCYKKHQYKINAKKQNLKNKSERIKR
jgi:hypothetical protein